MTRLPPALWAWLLAGSLLLPRLSVGLPADGFFSGDPGVKLIAAANALAHPVRPFEVDLPRLGGVSAGSYLERFFAPHGDHAHALQTPLFPVLSAPFIALFGIRGAYVLPALSFLALIPLLWVIRERLALTASPMLLGGMMVAASPLFFYALEFWEHVPAVAALAAATALALGHGRAGARDSTKMLGAGLAGGLAILLRPEAVWYMTGLVAALAACRSTGRGPRWLVAGLLLGLAPFVVHNWLHSGSLAGLHIDANLAPLSGNWSGLRSDLVRLWLLPPSPAGIGALVLFAGAVAGHFLSGPTLWLRLTALASGAVLAGQAGFGSFHRESVWQLWPVLPLAMVPMIASSSPGASGGRRLLVILAAVTCAGVVVSASHDGGAQWGPRFLLVASPPLMLLAADTGTQVLRSRQRVAIALVCAILVSGALASRSAYRQLQGAKRYYARIVEKTATALPPGGVIVTDLWWFDQITAPLYGRSTTLFVADAGAARALMRQLRQAGVAMPLVVRSRGEAVAGPTDDWIAGSCYSVTRVEEIPERELSYVTLGCRDTAIRESTF